ncbi:MAG: DUF1730 domain-containing protein [Deltaproteobacteria bacterium]|nr:DUF1730 domain-containing protein [Deltaproteobacteria bacterium]
MILSNATPDRRIPGSKLLAWSFLADAAADLGFVAVGAAPSGKVPAPALAAYRAWLDDGRHADLGYLARNEAARADTSHRGILTGAKAVISAALPYGSGATDQGVWGAVAAHARSIDYHAGMSERLESLARRVVARFPGARFRVLVDAAPIMERAWAMAAGLGSVGRHGGLLVPGAGSRVWLGEIVLTDVPVPEPVAPRVPFESCGNCRACMDACPTGAIVASGVVDCRACLSYHTVENRAGSLPEAVAKSVRLIFGCDACTSACPLDAPGVTCALPAPPEAGPPGIGPAELAAMDDAAVARLVEGTCLARTGAAALRRNARLAAAHIAGSGIS